MKKGKHLMRILFAAKFWHSALQFAKTSKTVHDCHVFTINWAPRIEIFGCFKQFLKNDDVLLRQPDRRRNHGVKGPTRR